MKKGDIELTLTMPKLKEYHIQVGKLDAERIYELDIKGSDPIERTLAQ